MVYKVGQIVFCVANRRKNTEKKIVEGTIEKVGRKYIHIRVNNDLFKFNKDDLTQDNFTGSPDYFVYLSEQAIFEEEEFARLNREIRHIFGDYGKPRLTLEQMRGIHAIIFPKGQVSKLDRIYIIQYRDTSSDEYALTLEEAEEALCKRGFVKTQNLNNESENDAALFERPADYLFKAQRARIISRKLIGTKK